MDLRPLMPVIFFLKFFTAEAQSQPPDRKDSIIKLTAIQNAVVDNEIRTKTTAPFGAGSLPNFFSSISVSSFFKEGVNGKIELQGKFASQWSGGLSIDQKIGTTDKAATPIDLTGISPGTTVAFNVLKMFWRPQFNLSDKDISQLMNATRIYAARNKIPDSRTVGLRDIDSNGTNEEKKIAATAFAARSFKQPVFLNIKAGFTKTAFNYSTDSITLKQINEAYITPTVTVSLIRALGNGFKLTGYVALSYNYSESYIAANNITFNIPFGTTRNFYTSSIAFGKPVKRTNNNIILELRQNIFTQTNSGNYISIAISPSATLGINTKQFSIFLPVYLIRGSDDKGTIISGLQGGVRFGYITGTETGNWSSFKDGFTAQLIITEPLDFLKKIGL